MSLAVEVIGTTTYYGHIKHANSNKKSVILGIVNETEEGDSKEL